MTAAPDLNEADLHYLAEALDALDAAAELSNVAAVRGSDVDVRALARWTLAAQHRLIAAVNDCLEEHVPSAAEPGHPGAHHRLHAGPAAEHLRSLDGPSLDRAFVESLTAHVHQSLLRARAEMVEGLDDDARGIAQQAIRTHSHELEAIDRLPPVTTHAAPAWPRLRPSSAR